MKKKNIQTGIKIFDDAIKEIEGFLGRMDDSASEADRTWAYEYAIIRLYRDFECFVFFALVTAINQDTEATLNAKSKGKKIKFPKHLRDDVCEYIIVGDRYFDFKDKDNLVGKFRDFLPENHKLLKAVRSGVSDCARSLNLLSTLRNLAAHNSLLSKEKAKSATGTNLSSAGGWLKHKTETRFKDITDDLKRLAREIEASLTPEADPRPSTPLE